jgi:hypothetical protein
MMPVDFVNKLSDAMPSVEELDEYGMDESEIEDIRRTFFARKRDKPIDLSGLPESSLTRLVRDYDCSTLEIGLVRFRETAKMLEHGWCFADCEAEEVVVTRDGTILLVDAGHPRLKCARDGTGFLNGLGEFIDLRRRKVEWKSRVSEAARKCAVAAGGDEYVEFFEMLCSFLR